MLGAEQHLTKPQYDNKNNNNNNETVIFPFRRTGAWAEVKLVWHKPQGICRGKKGETPCPQWDNGTQHVRMQGGPDYLSGELSLDDFACSAQTFILPRGWRWLGCPAVFGSSQRCIDMITWWLISCSGTKIWEVVRWIDVRNNKCKGCHTGSWNMPKVWGGNITIPSQILPITVPNIHRLLNNQKVASLREMYSVLESFGCGKRYILHFIVWNVQRNLSRHLQE